MTVRVSSIAVFVAGLLAASATVAQEQASLRLSFDVKDRTGTVSVALFDSAEAFDGGGKPVRAAQVAVAPDQTPEVVFEGLKPGRYGAKVMHDVNGNGKLDTNPFGLPTEPYAFSNNAKGAFGPAKWDAAAVEVAGTASQTIVLK